MTVDPRAVSGSAAAEAYEPGRPSYPPEAVAELARALGLGPESTVLDLAAGTGKLTRELVRHAGRVIAVEPSRGCSCLAAGLPCSGTAPGGRSSRGTRRSRRSAGRTGRPPATSRPRGGARR